MAYPHTLIAAISCLFILPAGATVGFFLTPFARKRRVLPWLLAPVVYVVTAILALTVAVNMGLLEP